MKSVTLFIISIFCPLCLVLPVQAQDSGFDVARYKQFLQQHQNLPASELMGLYPAGLFNKTAAAADPDILYLDLVDGQYQLTQAEKELLARYGFVVTERLQGESFGERLLDIYHKDLPVFVSSDAILHAFHRSYDQILRDIELECLIPAVKNLLQTLHDRLADLSDHHAANTEMQTMLQDVDLYLTIPRMLLDETAQPYFSDNIPMVNAILQDISALRPVDLALFSSTPKTIDFSQFKTRGHYLDEYHPELAAYFQAMIWLGRIEVYLLPPRATGIQQTRADMQRQVIDALLLAELVDLAAVYPGYQQIESILSFFIGEQDNVTLDNLNELKEKLNITDASVILDTLKFTGFQQTLALEPYAQQKILSQILMNDPCSPDSIIPASSFMLFGQRFVIDSYVTGNVVYDRIRYQNMAITRMLPSTLDILFALGNNAAGQILQAELEEYHYASNLTALRYLIDSYEPDFWDCSLYNMWLHTIQALNPPLQRQQLPPFAQTAAWWQKNMNTQLSSWTELRHDHLLYAKQSYTGGTICSFPYGYVDPVPQFFARLNNLGLIMAGKIQEFDFNNEYLKTIIAAYFNNLAGVCDTLQSLAQKEIDGEVFSTGQQLFLQRMITLAQGGCSPDYTAPGWYQGLFYSSFTGDLQSYLKQNYLVADYHTAPTDEDGFLVGWVAHAGTGPVDLLILAADLPGAGKIAFTGPVYSYHEYTSIDFLRLTDEEWQNSYLMQSARPSWTNLYICDNKGDFKASGPSLLTDITAEPTERPIIPVSHIIARCYPNPFNAGTLISFTLPERLSNTMVQLKVYNLQGQEVADLLDAKLTAGNYFIRWNGTDNHGHSAASGIYFYEVKAQHEKFIGKLQLIR
jgi:hypothetical protein